MTSMPERPRPSTSAAAAVTSAATAATSSLTSFGMSARPASRDIRTRRGLGHKLPPSFRPLFRAYFLAYAFVVAPRIVSLFTLRLARSHRGNQTAASGESRPSFFLSLKRILGDALHWQRFPAFCAVLVGLSIGLQSPIRNVLSLLAENLSGVSQRRLSRWCSSFIASLLGLQLLQSRKSASFTDTVSIESDSPHGDINSEPAWYAGRTLDLTLFAATRALDVLVGELWSLHRRSRQASGNWTKLEAAIPRLVDPAVFAFSSGLIMWTWVYTPSRLPHTYNKWISTAAAVDPRLIEALRQCRSGGMRYGKNTGFTPILQSMCADYNRPLEWGDPAKTVPLPCELVHMGTSPSCEIHAISKFGRSFQWAMRTYLPLNLLLIARNPNRKSAVRAFVSAVRSSAFLGAFITLFYYGVCLARTRVGPYLLGKDVVWRRRIEGGICVGSGCFFCGWSILVEFASRRKDLALFVAPRALATLLPRRYPRDKQWRETLVFACSAAIVLTCVQENKRRVRGLLGGLLATILEA